MPRKRFTPAEKVDFAKTGTAVEYRNGSQWHGATTLGPLDHDSLGLAYVPVEITKSRGTLDRGQYVRGYPTYLRLPAGA